MSVVEGYARTDGLAGEGSSDVTTSEMAVFFLSWFKFANFPAAITRNKSSPFERYRLEANFRLRESDK